MSRSARDLRFPSLENGGKYFAWKVIRNSIPVDFQHIGYANTNASKWLPEVRICEESSASWARSSWKVAINFYGVYETPVIVGRLQLYVCSRIQFIESVWFRLIYFHYLLMRGWKKSLALRRGFSTRENGVSSYSMLRCGGLWLRTRGVPLMFAYLARFYSRHRISSP